MLGSYSEQEENILQKIAGLITFKNLIVGLLTVTVVGATGVGIYDAAEGNTAITAGPVQDETVSAKVAAIAVAVPDDQVQDHGAAGVYTSAEMQIFAAEWALTGVVTGIGDMGLSVQTVEGLLEVQLGLVDFWQGQGVNFAVGDEVELLGTWQENQFLPGEVIKTAASERVIVRDPNGLPLWGGSGNSGAGQAAGGHAGTAGQGNGTSGERQYRGGR